jgi:hypothetical protein
MYEPTFSDHECLHNAGFPLGCLQDIAIQTLKDVYDTDDFTEAVSSLCSGEVCRYHQRDESHPEVVAKDTGK